MKSVRIEAVATLAGSSGIGPLYVIDVVCDCGANGLTDEATGESSFKHQIASGPGPKKMFTCRCGKKYRLRPQTGHIHIEDT